MKTLWVVALTLVVVGGVGTVVRAVEGRIPLANALDAGTTRFVNQTKVLASAGLKDVSVQVDTADVHITPYRGKMVTMHVHGSVSIPKSDRLDIQAAKSGFTGYYIVKVIRPQHIWFGNESSHLEVDIQVPSAMDTDWKIQVGTGDLYVTSLRSQQFRVQAGTGDIHLQQVNAPLQVQEGTGDISVQGAPSNQNIHIDSGTGDVHVAYASPPTSLSYHLESGLGDITLFHQHKSRVIQGTLGHGATNLQIKSGTGDITVTD